MPPVRVLFIALMSIWVIRCSPSDPLVVDNAWTRPTPAMPSDDPHQHHDQNTQTHSGNRAAVYLTLRNTSTQAERLIHLSTPVADTVEIHHSDIDKEGIMRMKTVTFLDIPPGQEVAFKPGGYHLMLLGVDMLQEGDEFPLRLTFESQQTWTTSVKVGHLDRK